MFKSPPPLDTSRHALFLDFDGTLVDLSEHPSIVNVDPRINGHLAQLQEKLSGAIALVSGRRIADLDRFLFPFSSAAAGVHGLERRSEPGMPISLLAVPSALDEARKVLEAAALSEHGVIYEDKCTALVLNYRTSPEIDIWANELIGQVTRERPDLTVTRGDRIIEVHPSGMHKGRAVDDLMNIAPFNGRQPIYVGDDIPDEQAFRYVRNVGGIAIKIGYAASDAEFHLRNVEAFHHWLRNVPES